MHATPMAGAKVTMRHSKRCMLASRMQQQNPAPMPAQVTSQSMQDCASHQCASCATCSMLVKGLSAWFNTVTNAGL